jgi:uncharacterized membrane protein YkgB
MPASDISRYGARIESAGRLVALYGAVLVLLMIGGLKFTAYEAEAIRPLVEASPLLGWAYGILSPRSFSNLLGVIEIATGLMLAVAPLAPLPGVVGAAGAATTFAVTSTFLITGPSWEASLGGFPALSPFGGFVVKDLALLGIAVSTLGRAARGTRAGPIGP